ncbi:hypothetical protein BH10PSE17_BH10PSE17_34630 [soil metagenome]
MTTARLADMDPTALPVPPAEAAPAVTSITLHAKSRVLEIGFADGQQFRLDAEYLRVMSPSAEVRGHGPGQDILQVGKRAVGIRDIEPIGHYALKPHFDDGHESGLFTWDYLYWLARHRDAIWTTYLARLEAAGKSRDGASANVVAMASVAPAEFNPVDLRRP